MRTISIMNHKGGCGKTTTAINLSACLDYLGKRVLIIDFDPQCHATIGLSSAFEKPSKLLSTSLLNGSHFKNCIGRLSERFHIIPSDYSLSETEGFLSRSILSKNKLKEGLASLSSDYDFAIIDCPPSRGILVENALQAAEEIIIAMDCSFFTLHGVAQLMALIENKRREGSANPRVRALATMYDRRNRFSMEVLREMRNFFGNGLFNTVIHCNIKLREAASYGLSIASYSKNARGFKDYLSLANEVLEESGFWPTLERG
ncbi:MAG: ParA family protein [Acidobacteriota bacterium]